MTNYEADYEETFKDDLNYEFSLSVLEHALNPKTRGKMKESDSYAVVTGSCGDTMEIWLAIEDKKITQATFETDGCITTIATGSLATEMVKGKGFDEAMQIDQYTILKALGGLPRGSEHCALLAANTLRGALSYLMLNNRI